MSTMEPSTADRHPSPSPQARTPTRPLQNPKRSPRPPLRAAHGARPRRTGFPHPPVGEQALPQARPAQRQTELTSRGHFRSRAPRLSRRATCRPTGVSSHAFGSPLRCPPPLFTVRPRRSRRRAASRSGPGPRLPRARRPCGCWRPAARRCTPAPARCGTSGASGARQRVASCPRAPLGSRAGAGGVLEGRVCSRRAAAGPR